MEMQPPNEVKLSTPREEDTYDARQTDEHVNEPSSEQVWPAQERCDSVFRGKPRKARRM